MQTFEAGLDGFTVRSNGSKLLGGLYRAAGAGSRPTAILLHGLPGVEKNLDVAYALREAGWNCAYFHYRGSWGSEGDFTLAGRHDDLLAGTDWLAQQPCVDGQRLALFGHSAGGYLALMAGADDPRFKAMVALCPLVSGARAPLAQAIFDEWAGMLDGISGAQLKSQWEGLSPAESAAEGLRNHPVLLLTGVLDNIFPPGHYPPLIAAIPTIEWHEFANADPAFSLCRRELVERTVSWLVTQLGQ
jgi:dipeptidyl aminopeptidase/acylaminoacyl peptidase